MDEAGLGRWAYLAACLVVPAAWGALTAWLFGRRDRRRGAAAGRGAAPAAPPRPPIDYTI